MINQYEVPALIEDTVPELRRTLHQFPAVFHIYETVTCLGNYTCQQLKEQHYGPAARSLLLAGRLYERGNQVVKHAIEDHFLPMLSRIQVTDTLSRIRLYSIVPASLYSLFIQQQLNQVHQTADR